MEHSTTLPTTIDAFGRAGTANTVFIGVTTERSRIIRINKRNIYRFPFLLF